MPGGFDLSGGSVSLGGPAAPVYVCRYNDGNLSPLYNVVCTGVSERYGPAPPTATFRYLFDDAAGFLSLCDAEEGGHPLFGDEVALGGAGLGLHGDDDAG